MFDLESRIKNTKESVNEVGIAIGMGLARTAFITPALYLSELIAGLNSNQGKTLRMISFAVNTIVAYPYQKWIKPSIEEFADKCYNKYITPLQQEFGKNVIPDTLSSSKKNKIAFITHQAPIYAGMIYLAAQLYPESMTLEKGITAWASGLAVGWSIANPFQTFMKSVVEYAKTTYKHHKEHSTAIMQLGKKYTKNFAYATLAAATVRLTILSGGALYNSSVLAHPEQHILVMNHGSEGMYWVNKKNFDPKTQGIVFETDEYNVNESLKNNKRNH